LWNGLNGPRYPRRKRNHPPIVFSCLMLSEVLLREIENSFQYIPALPLASSAAPPFTVALRLFPTGVTTGFWSSWPNDIGNSK
jgi:hypothetical protein